MTENRTDIPRPVVLTAIVVVLAAAVSAGIHAGLVPEHLAEMPLLGVSFIVTVLALLAIAAALAIRPEAQLPASLAAFLFAGLILAYAASRTTGLPVLEPEPERVDAIGIVTVAVQLFGLLAALWSVAFLFTDGVWFTQPAHAAGPRSRIIPTPYIPVPSSIVTRVSIDWLHPWTNHR